MTLDGDGRIIYTRQLVGGTFLLSRFSYSVVGPSGHEAASMVIGRMGRLRRVSIGPHSYACKQSLLKSVIEVNMPGLAQPVARLGLAPHRTLEIGADRFGYGMTGRQNGEPALVVYDDRGRKFVEVRFPDRRVKAFKPFATGRAFFQEQPSEMALLTAALAFHALAIRLSPGGP
jgi:hypothetical protein